MPSYRSLQGTPSVVVSYSIHRTEIESKTAKDGTINYRYHCIDCHKRGKYQNTPRATRRGALAHSRAMGG